MDFFEINSLPDLCIQEILTYIPYNDLISYEDNEYLQKYADLCKLELTRRERAARPIISNFLTNAYTDSKWLAARGVDYELYKPIIDLIYRYNILSHTIWEELCATGENIFAEPNHLYKVFREVGLCHNGNTKAWNFVYFLWSYLYH